MIHKLDRQDLAVVEPLFQLPHLSFVISAVIAGNSPGEIWVDEPFCPKAALLWDRGPRFYFAGSSENNDFSSEIKRVILEQIAPPPDSYLVVYYTSDSWEEQIPTIYTDRPLGKAQRRLYKLDQIKIPGWRERVERGLSIRQIDRQVLSESNLANLDSLLGEIESMWPSVDLFLESAFGFCAIWDEQEIICWCTAEYVSGKQAGIGIETVWEHRQKGIATLTAAAFTEHCHDNDIEAHWDTWISNAASVRVAEKVGFKKVIDYEVFEGK